MAFVGQETINIQILWLPVGCCESGPLIYLLSEPVVTRLEPAGTFIGNLFTA